MPHSHLGFSAEERIASRITLGRVWLLDAAWAEFEQTSARRTDPLSGDSAARWADFVIEAGEGGTVYEFTGEPRDENHSFYPTRGFVLRREGRTVAGVVLESALNPSYLPTLLRDLGCITGQMDLPLDPEEEAELIANEKADRVADYWGGPVASVSARPTG